MEQLLWLTTNLIADSDKSHVAAFEYQIDKLLGIVLHNFSHQFGPELWGLFTWCFNVLSAGLQFLKQPDYEIFNLYIVMHYKTILEVVVNNPKVEEKERQDVRNDLMRISFNCIKDAQDEEINFVVNQTHIQQLAFDLLKEFNLKNVEMCIRFFGNLFAVNDEICSAYVRNKGIIDVIKKVFTYCSKQTRKEAIWLASNIAANSDADAQALCDSQIMVSLLMACRDSAYELRKEGMWALSNIIHRLTDEAHLTKLIEMDVMSCINDILQRDGESGTVASLGLTALNELLTRSDQAKVIF